MSRLLVALLATVTVLSAAHADPAKPGPFSNKSFGDGGGYKHPDADVGQYIEQTPKQEPAELKPEQPIIAAKSVPEITVPAAAQPIASRPRPRPFAPVPASAASSRPEEKAGTQTVARAGAQADVAGAAEDAASEEARRDYETRLLGAAPGAARPGLGGAPGQVAQTAQTQTASPLVAPEPAPGAGEGMLFVSLELDPRESGTLRDAVADLGAAASFRPDARFEPLPAEGGGVRISGWLPASRLGDAISRRGVRRVAVERSAHPADDTRILGDFLVNLRVADPSREEASTAESIRTLAEATGFKLTRVYGVETAPGGGATALVSGSMPLSQLSRALGVPGVLKVSAAPAADETPAAPAAPAEKEGFLQYVMNRGLWLVLLTILLAVPTVGEAIKSGLAVFVPYR